jgi:hypothetical protein
MIEENEFYMSLELIKNAKGFGKDGHCVSIYRDKEIFKREGKKLYKSPYVKMYKIFGTTLQEEIARWMKMGCPDGYFEEVNYQEENKDVMEEK